MQGGIQLVPVLYRPTIQCVFQCAEEPLDSPILPGAMRFDPLVAYTHQPEGETKESRPEHDFVIGAQSLGPAETFNAVGQRTQECGSRFVLEHCESEIGSRTVIQYAED